MKIDKKAVGQRIKNIRLNKGMTLEEFGKLFNASFGNVKSWEIGNALPNKERIKTISKIVNISINELLYGTSIEKELEIYKKFYEDIKNYVICNNEIDRNFVIFVTLLLYSSCILLVYFTVSSINLVLYSFCSGLTTSSIVINL